MGRSRQRGGGRKRNVELSDDVDVDEVDLNEDGEDLGPDAIEDTEHEEEASEVPQAAREELIDEYGSEGEDGEDYDETAEEQAEMIMMICKPVSITMVILIAMVKAISVPDIGLSPGQVLLYQESSDKNNDEQQIFGALLTGGIVLVSVLCATTLFILLYKYKCMKIIYGWLLTASGLLLAMFGGLALYLFLTTVNFAFDWLTFGFLTWNFGVTGLVAIFWYAPPKLTQAYLVAVSVLMAGALTQLPEFATWIVLGLIAIYDIFAVLCPRGPLKVLVDTATERQEAIPALLYSAAAWMMMVTPAQSTGNNHGGGGRRRGGARKKRFVGSDGGRPDDDDDDDNDDDDDEEMVEDLDRAPTSAEPRPASSSSGPSSAGAGPSVEQGGLGGMAAGGVEPLTTLAPERKKGIQLGLGDFVFYSVLVGRSSLFDYMTVYTTFTAVIFGLFLTLFLLAVFQRALPALPISIGLGMLFYFTSSRLLVPYIELMAVDGVFL